MVEDPAAVPGFHVEPDDCYCNEYTDPCELARPPGSLSLGGDASMIEESEYSMTLSSTPHMSSPSSTMHQCTPPHEQLTDSSYTGCFDSWSPIEPQLIGQIVGGRFQLMSVLGHGSFGFTLLAEDLEDGCRKVALKLAKAATCTTYDYEPYEFDEFLGVEWSSYQGLRAAGVDVPCAGFPATISAGIHTFSPDNQDGRPYIHVSYIAMELLGPTVWSACNKQHCHKPMTNSHQPAVGNGLEAACGQPDQLQQQTPPSTLSSEWIINTGKGMLKALANVHMRGFIHRDVKTENFCLNLQGSNDSISLIDFGFARPAYGCYSFSRAYGKRCASFWGTPNYASLSSLWSYPQTPRDDLEALAYCILELEQDDLRLPWSGTLTTNSEAKDGWSIRQLENMAIKKQRAWADACQKGLVPDYLQGYLKYVTSLTPQDIPDYAWLMLQLDSGITQQPPSKAPRKRCLQDWPNPDDIYVSNKDYAQYATLQAAAAAAEILPSDDRIQAVQSALSELHRLQHGQPRKRALTAGDDWLCQQEEQFGIASHSGHRGDDLSGLQQRHKRFKSSMCLVSRDTLLVNSEALHCCTAPMEAAAAADATGAVDMSNVMSPQHLQHELPGSKCTRSAASHHFKKQGRLICLEGWPMLNDSQTETEE